MLDVVAFHDLCTGAWIVNTELDTTIKMFDLTISDLHSTIMSTIDAQGKSHWSVKLNGSLIFQNFNANASLAFGGSLPAEEFYIL